MRTDYYHQLRKYLEPESISIHSKTKSLTAISQQSLSTHRNSSTKIKQDLFRNQRPQDSFGSFDASAFLDIK